MDKQEQDQIGKLSPRHKFFLNPYPSERFSRCPSCEQPTKARKKPFLIHIEPKFFLCLNMTGRYCPNCDLIILHQDVVEDLLARFFEQNNPSIIGNDYLIIGTMERSFWLKYQGKGTSGPMLESLHDFQEVVFYK